MGAISLLLRKKEYIYIYAYEYNNLCNLCEDVSTGGNSGGTITPGDTGNLLIGYPSLGVNIYIGPMPVQPYICFSVVRRDSRRRARSPPQGLTPFSPERSDRGQKV